MRHWHLLLGPAVVMCGLATRLEAGTDPEKVAAEIDRLVEQRLARAGIPASPPADDAEFLRRVTLDITGRIPTYDETIAFLGSDDPQKRGRRIEELLASPAYGEHFATIWNELILPPDTSAKPTKSLLAPWLAEQFNRGRGWDAIVTELLIAEGKIRENPQAGFIQANSESFEPQPNLLADATARLFWGVQLRCAECHDHPFAPWTQADFWGTAAFFSRVRKGYADGKNPKGFTLTESAPDEPISQKFTLLLAASDVAGPAIVVPESGGKLAKQVIRAKFLAAEQAAWSDAGPFRPRFAAWATSGENPWFAANAANRLWAHLFGRGRIHPLDGFHADNLPSRDPVLVLLTQELADSQFDLKHLIRAICNSQAYQRSSRPVEGNRADTELFSHMAVKPLRPEMLYDALSMVLYPPQRKPGGKNIGALQPLPGTPREEFVRWLGTRPSENEGSVVNTGIPQFLRLLNGDVLNRGAPGLDRFLKGDPTAEEVVQSLYLAVLARRPTMGEQQLMAEYLAEQTDREQGYAGVRWALINCAEFGLNH